MPGCVAYAAGGGSGWYGAGVAEAAGGHGAPGATWAAV